MLRTPKLVTNEPIVERRNEELEKELVKVRQWMCGNAVLSVEPCSIVRKKIHLGGVKVDAKYCQNRRRNGSKYCQVCSDAYEELSS